MRHTAPAQRARLLHLFVCFSLLAQTLIPQAAAAAPAGPAAGVPLPTADRGAGRQEAEAADLPDLEEVRRRPHREPKAVPPVPSKRRRCPPRNPRCNEDADGAPAATPTPSPIQPPRGNPHAAAADAAPEAPVLPPPSRFLAAVTAPPLWPLPAAGGGRNLPTFDFSLLDFYRGDGGYGHSDVTTAGPLAGFGGSYGGSFPFVQGGATNLAQGKTTRQSSTLVYNPSGDDWRAVDGNTDGNYMAGSVTHTNGESQPWWQVDLGGVFSIGNIDLWNRTDCCSERLTGYYVFVSDSPFTSNDPAQIQAQAGVWTNYTAGQAPTHSTLGVNRTGRYVRVQLAGTGILSLAEAQVFAGGIQVVPPQGIPPAESVAWTNVFGVTASGNSLTKVAANGWDAGAMSTKAIASDDGYAEFTAEGATNRMFGLSRGDSNQHLSDIDFAIHTQAGGALYVFEGGVSRGQFGTYAAGDRLRVAVEGGQVRYRRNGALLYTSATPPQYPLLVDTSLYETGAIIGNAVISGALVENVAWTNVAGVTAAGNNLTRTGAPAWNAGASSTRTIAGGDGYAEFTAEGATNRMFGLSRGDSNQSYADIDFAIHTQAGGGLYVFEGGVSRGQFGTYAVGDRLRVAVEGGQVRYRRNGTLLYTSATPPQYPLLVDTSVYETGAIISNAVISAPLASQADPGGTGLTGRYYDNSDFTNYKLTRLDYTVNFDWSGGAPLTSMGADDFSVRWTGMVVPRYSETYTFYATTDDGVRLWVDGQLIIDRWQDQAPYEAAGTIALEAGRQYTVRMEYYDRGGAAQASLRWYSQSQAKEIVPQSRLLPCWKPVEQFVIDFYQTALRRPPTSYELQDWTQRLTQAQGEGQQIAAAQELGRALFGPTGMGTEYVALNPSDTHRFVSDLYLGYLQRAPDAGGLLGWETAVTTYGRGAGTAAFEESIEFKEKVLRLCGTAASSGTSGGDGYNFAAARLDPSNRTGGGGADAYSRNYNFQIPLVGLAGRAGLDLGLTLSYNSLVWTKDGTGVTFDADRGTPGPGFRLGFPTVQPKFYNPQTQKNAYLLVTPSGERVELRQVETSNVYESADSSYLQLIEGGGLTLLSSDGTQLGFAALGGEWRCFQVKDRNGNYISASYYGDGRIWTVTDTLGRVLTFNYDNYQNLLSITQPWRRETEANPNPAQDETHQWATFGYANVTLQPQFTNLAVIGEQPGTVIPALSQVGLADGSYYKFSYNLWGQVWKVTHYAADSVAANGQPNDAHPLNSTRLNLPGSDLLGASAQGDCPRFTEERAWVENGVMNQSAEVTTSYDAWSANMASCEVTLPDNTTKQVSNYYTSADGWKKGLVASQVATSGGATVRTTTLTWEHDGGANYPTNPRVAQTSVTDPLTQPLPLTRTTQVTYTIPADFQGSESGYYETLNVSLPKKVEECAGSNCSTPLRTTVIDYKVANLAQYVQRRILGLARKQSLYYGADSSGNLRSQVEYRYDEPDDSQNNDTFLAALPTSSPAASQHDGTNYGQSMRWRGNTNRVQRYSVNQTNGAVGSYVESRAAFNVTGTLSYAKNALGHQTSVSYSDSFFQNINRTAPLPQNQIKTFAYPTTVTDPDGFASGSSYNYDLGVVREGRTPKPNQTANLQGPPSRSYYDAAGRLIRAVSDANGAYTRVVYTAKMDVIESYTLVEAGKESRSAQVLDGAGRTRATSRYLPPPSDAGTGTYVGNYSGQRFDYDEMGRLARQSNPAEVTASWTLAGEDAASGWLYTQTTYDWKGRPLKTTNTDLSTIEYDYGGCGCAGGETVSTRDEVGRRQRVTYDELGRPSKTQVFTEQDKGDEFIILPTDTPYSTVTNSYDALDRVREVNEREEATGAEQVTTTEYDGHGRLWRRHLPQQDPNKFTTYAYNDDDTLNTVTDGRGAVTTYFYENNNRHLVTKITYAFGGGLPLTHTYTYDAAGNRKSAFDAPDSGVTYQYDDLSRLTSEARTFGGLTHANSPYTLVYTYNLAGQLETLKDPFGEKFTYGYDRAGQLTKVMGTAFANVTTYAKDVQYRAWGGVKAATLAGGGGQTTTYDARMRPYEYRLGTLLRENFTYYADGKLKQITDLDDGPGPTPPSTRHFMSRSYSYDLVGRVAGAGGLNTSPYQQGYRYDAFGNLTWRSGFYGYDSSATKTDTAHYTNGRRDGWDHDQDGRLTYSPAKPEAGGPARWWEYDKAGRQTKVVEAASGGGSNNFTTSYDCDGQTIYEASLGASVPTTSYYMVRSSVLGGQVITRLDSSGGKAITYVPARGLVEARQSYAGGQEVVSWTYKDPHGVTEKVPGSEPAAYDPLGNYTQHTTLQPPQVQTPTYYGAWSAFTNSYNYPTGCIQDGRPADCNSVVHNLTDGLANRQGPQIVGNHRIEFDPMPMGSPYGAGGPVPYYVPGGQRRDDGSGDGGTKKGPDGEDVIVTNHSVTPGGFWTLLPYGSIGEVASLGPLFIAPQDSGKPSMDPGKRNDCYTFRMIIESFKDAFRKAWVDSVNSKKENGGWIFYEFERNTFELVRASEGEASTMPQELREFRETQDKITKVYTSTFILDFHVHPLRDRKPSSGDVYNLYLPTAKRLHAVNPLGLIIYGPGEYSYYDEDGRIMDDKRLDECIKVRPPRK